MPSIGTMIDVAEALRTPAVTVCAQNCTHRHHQASTCSRCEQVCPTQAITVSADGPELDPMACIDCGACVTACPTGAVEPLKPPDSLLVEWVATRAACFSHVSIACARIPSPGRSIATVPCLARLDPSLLLFAFAKGADSVSLYTGTCGECSEGLAPRVESLGADTRRLLDQFRLSGSIDVREGLEPSESGEAPAGGLTRRGFFEALRRGGRGYGAKALTVLMPESEEAVEEELPRRELPVYVPAMRRRLLVSLRALVPEGSSEREVNGPFLAPELDRARCNGCAICGRICPTGALGIEGDGESDTLRITCLESVCVACGLCAEICRHEAISLAPIPAGRALARGAGRRTLFVRGRREAETLFVPVEDRMRKLLGAAIHRV